MDPICWFLGLGSFPTTAFILWIFLTWIQSIPYLYGPLQYFTQSIGSQSNRGIFYLFLFSSLFFLPIPLEVLYLTLATKIDPTFLATHAVLGILAGQVVNYLLGRLFGFTLRPILKKSTQKKAKEKLAKYGGFAVFTIHSIPFPFQIFNVVTGLFKYPLYRWMPCMSLGILLKFVVLMSIAVNV